MIEKFLDWLDTTTFSIWEGLIFGGAVLIILFGWDLYKLYRKYTMKRDKLK